MLIAFSHDREIDHHDSVLLDDADQQNDTDRRDQAEIKVKQRPRVSIRALRAGYAEINSPKKGFTKIYQNVDVG